MELAGKLAETAFEKMGEHATEHLLDVAAGFLVVHPVFASLCAATAAAIGGLAYIRRD